MVSINKLIGARGVTDHSLGIKIDQALYAGSNGVCRASVLDIRRIASIRPHLSWRTSARPVAVLITSRLDYCNSVLAGLHAEQIVRLQRVQNSAAQLVLKKQKLQSFFLHIPDSTHPPILERETFENRKTQSLICWRPFFQFHCSNCLEFTACQFAEFPHPLWLQSLAQNLLFEEAFSQI